MTNSKTGIVTKTAITAIFSNNAKKLFILMVVIIFLSRYPDLNPVGAVTNETCGIDYRLDSSSLLAMRSGKDLGSNSYMNSKLNSLVIDLGDTKTVCFVDLGWNGGGKSNSFRISTSFSPDSNYTGIFSGKGAPTTTELQRIDFQDVEARLLKISSKEIANLANVNVYVYQPSPNGSRLPELPNLPLYDNFDNASKTDEKWSVRYNGYGESQVKNDTGSTFYSMNPKPSKNINETHAALLTSNAKLSDFVLVTDVRTDKQLRINSPPNSWEVAWIFFRYTDTFHYYWFSLKPNGIELGKKNCNNCHDPVAGQIILFTAALPTLKLGTWSQWTIQAEKNHIMISVDGNKVIDFVDKDEASSLKSGRIALYTEDAVVSFDNIYIGENLKGGR